MKTIAFILAFACLSLRADPFRFTPSEPTLRRVSECGVQSYNQKSNHPDCGVASYKQGSGPACGVHRYKVRRHELCGVEQYKEGLGGPCGYENHVKKVCGLKNPGGGCVFYKEEIIDRRGKVCRHKDFGAEVYKSCERAEFGVESYKTCKSPAFGTYYKTCRLPQFGVEKYKACNIRKTRYELDLYLSSTEPDIAYYAYRLAEAQSDFLFRLGQRKQISCLIERWQFDPLYDDIVFDMKNTYLATFGRPFVEGQFNCSVEEERLSVSVPQCEAFSRTDLTDYPRAESRDLETYQLCKIRLEYLDLKTFFTSHLKEVEFLLNDVVAKQSPSHRKKLEDLKNALSKVTFDPCIEGGCEPVDFSLEEDSTEPNSIEISEGLYMLRLEHSHKCLNLRIQTLQDPRGLQEGNLVQQWSCPSHKNEWTNNFWNVVQNRDGTYQIRSDFSDYCLTTDSSEGNFAVQMKCDESDSRQKFVFQTDENQNNWLIRNVKNQGCLGLSPGQNQVSDSGFQDGDRINVETCSNKLNEVTKTRKWILQRLN